jgi:gluconate 2-dehydrogenase gamma chain
LYKNNQNEFLGRTVMAQDLKIGRREFLTVAGAAALAPTVPAAAQQPSPATPSAASPPPAASAAVTKPATALPPVGEPLLTLTVTEHAFIVAVVDTLIPADELSPSGSDCGVATFIDRQLGSDWGGGARMYRSGPYMKGKPEQGYQLPLTPREFFTAGIAATNAWTRKTYGGKDFDRLSSEDRVAALKAMEEGKAAFENFSSRAFFARLHSITMAGFFADPMYGGNRDKIGWRILGFPGLPATYSDKVDAYRDKRYVAEPQSIADFS